MEVKIVEIEKNEVGGDDGGRNSRGDDGRDEGGGSGIGAEDWWR